MNISKEGDYWLNGVVSGDRVVTIYRGVQCHVT